LVTIVGVICIVAGLFPGLEAVAALVSSTFAAWFLSLVRAVLPVGLSTLVVVMVVVSTFDVALGIGTITRWHWAPAGMVIRCVVALPVEDLNFQAGNRIGAAIGLGVSLFMTWALLRPASREWFHGVPRRK
jgi:hypothetical protein